MFCKNCKHKGEYISVDIWDTYELEERVTDLSECDKIRHIGLIDSELPNKTRDSLSYTVDGEGYDSRLLVKDTFGCILFEEKN